MAVASIQQVLEGKIAVGQTVTVQGWVRTRRDSKAGLSFINVSDGSCFARFRWSLRPSWAITKAKSSA